MGGGTRRKKSIKPVEKASPGNSMKGIEEKNNKSRRFQRWGPEGREKKGKEKGWVGQLLQKSGGMQKGKEKKGPKRKSVGGEKETKSAGNANGLHR